MSVHLVIIGESVGKKKESWIIELLAQLAHDGLLLDRVDLYLKYNSFIHSLSFHGGSLSFDEFHNRLLGHEHMLNH